jgi:hypothetical protein
MGADPHMFMVPVTLGLAYAFTTVATQAVVRPERAAPSC